MLRVGQDRSTQTASPALGGAVSQETPMDLSVSTVAGAGLWDGSAHRGCWFLAVSLPSTHLSPSFWLLSLPVHPPAQSSPLCQGDRHDAESSL